MFVNNAYGIDLGTGNIKISSHNGKKTINERNMIAIKDDLHIIALGDKAYEIYEKAPKNIKVSCPMVGGVIGNIGNMEILLYGLTKKLSFFSARRSNLYIVVPTDVSEVEKRAFFAVVKGSIMKAHKVKIVEKALADAAYLDIDFHSERGTMIMNMGADTTEMSIISGGRIIISKTLKFGGNRLDERICTIVRRRYNLSIGMKTGELLKNELAYVCNGEQKNLKVYGVNIVTGLPRTAEISSAVVHEAILGTIDLIIDSAKSLLERTPPELVNDIMNEGIYITGGVSKIPNLPYYMKLETGFAINTTTDPVMSTIRGLLKIMNDKEYRTLAYSIKDMAVHI